MKGNYSHRYNPDKLRNLISEGKNAKEIMKTLGISLWSLKEHLLLLQYQDKKYYEIKGLFDRGVEPEEFKISEKDGILFSEELLSHTGFKEGDKCELIIETDRIIIKKL